MFRYRQKLTSHRASEKNRFQNALTVSNIAISSVLSDTFGKSATVIVDYIFSGETFDPEHCKSLLQKKAREKADDVVRFIIGYELHSNQSVKMKVCRKHIDYIGDCIKSLDEKISNLVKNLSNWLLPFRESQKDPRLTSLPRSEWTCPYSNPQNACVPGRVSLPQNNENAGKKKRVHILRAGVYLKPLLVQCANAAIKDKRTLISNTNMSVSKNVVDTNGQSSP